VGAIAVTLCREPLFFKASGRIAAVTKGTRVVGDRSPFSWRLMHHNATYGAFNRAKGRSKLVSEEF
jgi:hypothetical protein